MSSVPSYHILVIDDEATHRILAKEYLEAAGYVVRLAEDGARGLSLAKRRRPDLILVDLLIPGVDGLALCRTLKSSPETANVPIILITASREADTIARGLEAGADDFVTKPVDWEFIGDRVGYVLARFEESRRIAEEVRSNAARILPGAEASQRSSTQTAGYDDSVQISGMAMQAAHARELQALQQSADAARQALEVQYGAQLAALREMLSSNQIKFEAEQEAARRRHEAERSELIERHGVELAAAVDRVRLELADEYAVEAAGWSDEVEKLKLEHAASQKASERDAAARVLEIEALYERRCGQLRREHDDAISALAARLESQHAAYVAEQEAAAGRERRDFIEKLEAAEARIAVARDAVEAEVQARISACWDFMRSCTTAYTNLVRKLSADLSEIRSNVASGRGGPAGIEEILQLEQVVGELAGGIGNMRMLSQMMSGKASLHETAFDLVALVGSAVEKTLPLAAHCKVEVEVDGLDQQVALIGDQARVEFAVLSLLMNAIRHSPHGSSITVSVSASEAGVGVIFRDHGVGIHPSHLHQLNACLDAAIWPISDEKVGLGVPTSMAIARAHGGHLAIESAVGAGTLARMQFPSHRVRSETSQNHRIKCS